MNKKVKDLFNYFGMPCSERSCTNNYVWNGRNLATRYHIWNSGHIRKFYAISDFQLCHELAHWLVADSTQRTLPEYGLAILGEFGANGGQESETFQSGILPTEEQEYQETLSYLLGLDLALQSSCRIPEDNKLHNSVYYLKRSEREKLPELLEDLENRGFHLTQLTQLLP